MKGWSAKPLPRILSFLAPSRKEAFWCSVDLNPPPVIDGTRRSRRIFLQCRRPHILMEISTGDGGVWSLPTPGVEKIYIGGGRGQTSHRIGESCNLLEVNWLESDIALR